MKLCKCDICKQRSITRRVYDNGIKYICDFCINVEKYDLDTNLETNIDGGYSSVGLVNYLDKPPARKSDTILKSIDRWLEGLERKWNNYWVVPLCDKNAYLKKII